MRLGQMVTEHFGLGLQVGVTGTQAEPRDFIGFTVGIEGQYEIAQNLAVLGGVALGMLVIDDQDDDELDGNFGASFFLGLSYDWFLTSARGSGGWALSPMVQVHFLPARSSAPRRCSSDCRSAAGAGCPAISWCCPKTSLTDR